MQMTEWISVKDRLPDPYEKVIVYNAENEETLFARRIEIGFKRWDAVTREFVNWRWIPYGDICITLDSVTHWMPRLKPPKETNETPSRTPTPDRIRHHAEILENEYSDRTVTIDNLIYMLRRLADIIAEDEPPKEEP